MALDLDGLPSTSSKGKRKGKAKGSSKTDASAEGEEADEGLAAVGKRRGRPKKVTASMEGSMEE